jgi:hypothetical protein
LFGTANNFTNKVISGWQISGISTFQGGQPFSVSYTCSGTGCVSGRADRVPGAAIYPGKKTRSMWFNPAAFAAPTGLINGVSTPGYAFGNSAYNMLWGPHYQDWDMNLQKTTTWAEKMHLQLRMDAFNVFNHPNFGTPNSAISNSSTVGTITGQTGFSRSVEFGAKLSF